jgi:predicted DNA-binding protein
MAQEDNDEVTHVRIPKRSKLKLDRLAKHEKRSTPKQLEVIIDREYEKMPTDER